MNLPSWIITQETVLVMAALLLLLLLLLPITSVLLTRRALGKQQSLFNEQQQQTISALNSENELREQLHEQQVNYLRAELEKATDVLEKRQTELFSLQERFTNQSEQIGVLRQKAQQLIELQQEFTSLKLQLNKTQTELHQVESAQLSQLAAFEKEKAGFEEKLALLTQAEEHLKGQFENLANKIFEQKATNFSQMSEKGLSGLLSPLKSQIDDFKKQITEQYIAEGKERAVLQSEILSLKALNQQITQEASALTNALKGDNKQQGNWGEVVLSRVLAESGLREGHEYEIQKNLADAQGKSFRPDVIVHLPQNKDVVIDSKVSLVAHERAVNAKSEDERKAALKEHVASVKGHIKGLSKKDYQTLTGVNTLDYVLMFLPIESAFSSAINEDPDIMKLAMDNQIMLVSPTNLLVALRTIHNIWQYEYQNQHAMQIAEKARKMYEKFVGFVDDMQDIGKHIERTDKSFQQAMNKLASGRGNLISQAESFKSMGVSPNKSLDKSMVEHSHEVKLDIESK